MKIKQTLSLIALLLIFSPLAQGKDRKIYQRGWVGGEFAETSHFLFMTQYNLERTPLVPVPGKDKKGILITKIYRNIPLGESDLEEKDLILSINDTPLKNLKTFYKIIDRSIPGESKDFQILRGEERLTLPVTIGKETYKKIGFLSIGIGIGNLTLDYIPNPSFNLLSILRFTKNNQRLEKRSPTQEFILSQRQDGSKEAQSHEGWEFGILPFSIGRNLVIISQERMAPLLESNLESNIASY